MTGREFSFIKPSHKKIQKRKEMNDRKTGRAHMNALARFADLSQPGYHKTPVGVSV